jgi:acetolactate synthase-1/2/3 large subunit
MQMGVGPVVLILNNGTYGTIRMHQERHFPHRISGTDLVNPDFATLAKAYGMLGERVTRTEDFAPAFERALANKAGAVLDITIATETLTPRQTIADIHGTP